MSWMVEFSQITSTASQNITVKGSDLTLLSVCARAFIIE